MLQKPPQATSRLYSVSADTKEQLMANRGVPQQRPPPLKLWMGPRSLCGVPTKRLAKLDIKQIYELDPLECPKCRGQMSQTSPEL